MRVARRTNDYALAQGPARLQTTDANMPVEDSANPGGDASRVDADLERRVCEDTAIWRTQAFDGYANVRDELHRLERCAALPSQSLAFDADRTAENVKRALKEALEAMVPRKASLKKFYSGSDIERAWLAIHRARAELYLLYPDVELKAQTESLGVLLADLPETSTLRGALTTALGRLGSKAEVPAVALGIPITPFLTLHRRVKEKHTPKGEAGIRAELQRIYEHAMGISDVLQRESRVLRNNMMVASVGIFAVVLALGIAHLVEPGIVSLCTGRNVCPIDGKVHPLDVFVVELAGMLGGLLSVVIPLSTGERIMTPYRVFNQQLILKTLAGAATAVGGLLLLGGQLISAVKIDDTTALLAYAVVFGFAQQIVTGAVDRRANALAKETPSVKDI